MLFLLLFHVFVFFFNTSYNKPPHLILYTKNVVTRIVFGRMAKNLYSCGTCSRFKFSPPQFDKIKML